MRIAVIWAFSTWKTTYVENYKGKELKAINLERWFNSQEEIFNNQIKFEKEHKDFITDNWLFTILAYTKKFRPELFEEQLRETKEYLKNNPYDKIILLEPLNKIEDDWFRFTDKELQLEIHNIILNILNENMVCYRSFNRLLLC